MVSVARGTILCGPREAVGSSSTCLKPEVAQGTSSLHHCSKHQWFHRFELAETLSHKRDGGQYDDGVEVVSGSGGVQQSIVPNRQYNKDPHRSYIDLIALFFRH